MASRYIKIAGNLFNREKVLHARARNSYLYWKYPYVVEMNYAKKWTETSYMNVGRNPGFSVPISSQHETMDYSWKYLERKGARDMLKYIKENCPNALVQDASK
jgi:hypothetical protein